MKIGKVQLNLENYIPENDIYSDGAIEDELLHIVKEHKENEVLDIDNRWPILYYFSPIRENILSWYDFTVGGKILEIGTGCGAITCLLCRKKLYVHGIESSKRRSIITAYRNKNCENLRISVGNFFDMNISEKYDYITLIGVLEYANMFIPDAPDAAIELLKKCRKLLKNNGKIFIAIENRLGAKYFSGAVEDHVGVPWCGIENYQNIDKVKTFSKSELSRILKSSGFAKQDWYYPYPDYKLPAKIFSDFFLPTSEMLELPIKSYDTNRMAVFDEYKLIKSISSEEEFKYLSNSFLVISE